MCFGVTLFCSRFDSELLCSTSDSDDAEDLEDQPARQLNSKAVYRRFKASHGSDD